MEFSLSTQLQNLLLENVIPKQKENQVAVKKPVSTFCVIPGLIPESILPTDLYQNIAEHIISCNIKNRFFRQSLSDDSPAILIYYYDYHWTAAWIPPINSNANYLFGYSIAYRDSLATLDKLNVNVINLFENTEEQHRSTVKVKRSNYNIVTRYVTIDDIKNSTCVISNAFAEPYCDEFFETAVQVPTFSKLTSSNLPSAVKFQPKSTFNLEYYKLTGYNAPSLSIYSSKRYSYTNAVNLFQKDILSLITGYEKDSHIFNKMCSHNAGIYFISFLGGCVPLEIFNIKNVEFNFNFIKSLVTNFYSDDLVHLKGDNFLVMIKNNLHIIDTPYFRKIINMYCEEANQIFQSTETDIDKLYNPMKNITKLIKGIAFVTYVYPDCPLDYIQSNHTILTSLLDNYMLQSYLAQDGETKSKGIQWLTNNLPVASFFNMLKKEYEKLNQEKSNRIIINSFGHDLVDIVSMINNIYNNNLTLTPPDRWRFKEFHDHVQSISWKISNKNINLPQVLFPEPVKIINDKQTWTFFQPKDTHQLADWGRHVRNCVGSSSYAEQIKKHKSFIVLCMINSNPTFTIQLEMNSLTSSLKVTQIKGLSNSSLNTTQQEEYKNMFTKALDLRTKQL